MNLTVDLGTRAYPIYIGAGVLNKPAHYVPHIKGRHVALVTNQTLLPRYGEHVRDMLQSIGKCVTLIVLPDGEAYKTWATLNLIFDKLLEVGADRHTTLLALGGGVIGDLAGFAAASYMRGIPFIQIPTTLLAQVDSAVGGKTGINHPLGKNMIGAFYQPRAVIADMAVLKTLPRRELVAGLAEVIKYGAMADAEFFSWIENNLDALLACQTDVLRYAVHRSCEIKSTIVAADERESAGRALLNFGHTFAHAMEAGLGYGEWLHGEAVGCGMVIAANLSRRLGLIDTQTDHRIRRLIQAAGLPIVAPALGRDRYLALMAGDKKNEEGLVRFILLSALGKAHVSTAPMDVLLEVLDDAIKPPPALA